jgi:hypothetical protein
VGGATRRGTSITEQKSTMRGEYIESCNCDHLCPRIYVGLKHLQSYLDEFVFRFNRRRTRHAAFRSLLGIAIGHAPISYKMLISPEAKA